MKEEAKKLLLEFINKKKEEEGKAKATVLDEGDVETIKDSVQEIVRKKIRPEITWTGDRCPAHKYELQILGKRKYVTYRCKRTDSLREHKCHHYATIENIDGNLAQCWDCGDRFIVKARDIIKNSNAKTVEDSLYERLTCGCTLEID